MSPEAGLIALLHLSAVAMVITIAYVRLDKTHDDSDSFLEGMDKARDVGQKTMQRLGLGAAAPLQPDKWRLTTLFPAGVISFIAGKPMPPMPLPEFLVNLHVVYRQCHVPFMGYFRKSNHLLVVGWMAVASTLCFLSVSAALIWRINWFADELFLKVGYVALAASILWVFITSRAASRLTQKKLECLCEKLENVIKERFEKRKARAARKLAKLTKTLTAMEASVDDSVASQSGAVPNPPPAVKPP